MTINAPHRMQGSQMRSVSFLDIPDELLAQVLFYLPLRDLVAAARAHKRLCCAGAVPLRAKMEDERVRSARGSVAVEKGDPRNDVDGAYFQLVSDGDGSEVTSSCRRSRAGRVLSSWTSYGRDRGETLKQLSDSAVAELASMVLLVQGLEAVLNAEIRVADMERVNDCLVRIDLDGGAEQKCISASTGFESVWKLEHYLAQCSPLFRPHELPAGARATLREQTDWMATQEQRFRIMLPLVPGDRYRKRKKSGNVSWVVARPEEGIRCIITESELTVNLHVKPVLVVDAELQTIKLDWHVDRMT